MSTRLLHGLIMISLPVVIFIYKTVYYIVTNKSRFTGDMKMQIKHSFHDMLRLLFLNILLVGIIHVAGFLNIYNLKTIKKNNTIIFYSPVFIEMFLYSILPILGDLALSATTRVKFNKIFICIGKLLKIGLYAKGLFNKETKIEINDTCDNDKTDKKKIITKPYDDI